MYPTYTNIKMPFDFTLYNFIVLVLIRHFTHTHKHTQTHTHKQTQTDTHTHKHTLYFKSAPIKALNIIITVPKK